VIIAVIAFPLLSRRNDPIARLIALAPASARQVEPRLSGGFAWAPYRGPMRSADSAADAERLKLVGAAGDAIARAQSDDSEHAQHAAGIALVLVDQAAAAIDRLRIVAEQSPNDVHVWSDLAAARYAASVRLQRPSLLPEALTAADHAVRIDPKSAEALFNRALILEHLGRTAEARSAWLRYLQLDSSSSWATEARAHLGDLPSTKGGAA
jgi:tetratricopeptide (TPR) repeat protein